MALCHRAVNEFWERLDGLVPPEAVQTVEYVAGESGVFVIAALLALNLWLFLWRQRPSALGKIQALLA